MTDTTLATHHEFAARQADDNLDDTPTWYATAMNLVVVYSRVDAGAVLAIENHPDEYAVIVSAGGTDVSVRAGDETLHASENTVIFVPPGDSTVQVASEGWVYRVFTRDSPIYSRASGIVPATSNPASKPLEEWPEPIGGYKIRAYRPLDYPENPSPIHSFRSRKLMVNMVLPMNAGRPNTKLSPHLHEDFEQVSVVTSGTFIHHVRRAWGTDMEQWRDDEHFQIDSPAASVIHAPDIHTSGTVGNGPFQIVDAFAPPRLDMALRGAVQNGEDYPMPGRLI